jgi:hypothetical protein
LQFSHWLFENDMHKECRWDICCSLLVTWVFLDCSGCTMIFLNLSSYVAVAQKSIGHTTFPLLTIILI